MSMPSGKKIRRVTAFIVGSSFWLVTYSVVSSATSSFVSMHPVTNSSVSVQTQVLLSAAFPLMEILRRVGPWIVQRMHRLGEGSPVKLTGLALLMAGRMRALSLREEWLSHLSGETGRGLTRSQQIRAAWGFLRAAVRYRVQDAADLAWRPIDIVLASRGFSAIAVYAPSLVTAMLLTKQGGLYGLIDHIPSIPAVWLAMYGLIRTGRWWRGVQPPEHHPHRKKSADQREQS